MKNKKLLIIFIGILLFNFLILNNLNIKLFAGDLTTAFCREEGVVKAVRILAYVITIIKILVPIFIMLTGIYSGYKCVINEQDAGGKKIVRMLIEKIAVGAFIFFVPSIVYAIMSFANGYDKTSSKFSECGKCLTSVSYCDSLLK